jgi:beta-N-acetylhexosaminidase
MSHTLEAAARLHLPIAILDRPNPLNGRACEGPILQPGYRSFVGRCPLPVRHGMTVGELAHLFRDAFELDVDLTVVKMTGWSREMWFDDTGLPWVPTSPAMPKLETATVYPGTCLLEGTNVSEGRGTTTPFECLGAPWIDSFGLADDLNELNLPGVRFRPTRFCPSTSKHNRKTCQGIYLHVIDRSAFRPVRTGLHILSTLMRLWPDDFAWLGTSWEGRHPHFDLLIGNAWVRESLDKGAPVSEIVAHWQEELAQFRLQRRRYELYDG